jgi:hypothetical protein
VKPLFRVKRYSHAKYKFLARAKVDGKWRRRYFATEAEAIAFAEKQNTQAERERYLNSRPLDLNQRSGTTPSTSTPVVAGELDPTVPRSGSELSDLASPIYLGPRIQRYLGGPWCMHLPFAYDLMRELKPRIFVQLGVGKGEPYFGFCQSVAEHILSTTCYGIDSWNEKTQADELGAEMKTEIESHNWRYSSFSKLKNMTFQEALPDFADGSVDLLHIDGVHRYEDAKSCFEAWLPKLSPDGIVLLHGVTQDEGDSDVWRLWDRIARPKMSFLFEFGHGLGVCIKRELPKGASSFLRALFNSNTGEKRRISNHYASAAAALALWHAAKGRPEEGKAIDHLRIQVFADQGKGFDETISMTADLSPGRSQTICFPHIETLRPAPGRRLRIDPVDCPAFVSISSIKLIRDSDDALLYSANSADDFQQIDVSKGVSRHEEGGDLLLVATDNDPQIYLPAVRLTENSRLEIALEPHPVPPSVLLRQKQALEAAAEKTAGELAAALEASQAEIGRQNQALTATADVAAQLHAAQSRLAILDTAAGTWQRTFADLQLSLDATKGELSRVAYHAEAREAQIKTLQTEIDRQRQALQAGADVASQLQLAQSRVKILETEATNWQKTFTELQVSLAASETEIAQLKAAEASLVATQAEAKAQLEATNASLAASEAEVARQAQALRESAEVSSQLEATKASLAASEAEVARQAQELRESAETKAQLQATQASLVASQAEVARQAQALAQGLADLQAAQARIATAEASVTAWRKSLAEVEASFDANQAELVRVTHHLKVKDAQIKTLHTAVAETHARWSELTAELTLERSQNREQQEGARAREAALQAAIEQAHADSITEQSRSRDLQAQVELDQEQITHLESEAGDLRVAVEVARTQWNQLAGELHHAQFQNGELRAQTELDAERLATLESELRHLHTVILEGRAEMGRIASDLREAQYQNRELQAQTELDAEQIAALEQSRAEADRASHERIKQIENLTSAKSDRLSAIVDLQKRHGLGLRRYQAHLERRLEDVSQRVRAAGQALKRGDPEMPAIVDMILEDIRRIHDPSFFWKTAKALGLLRLAHAGVPRTAEERRALARELKAGLREICQAISSPTTTPEEAAMEIPRLFQLRRQTRELLQSLKLSGLVLQRSHIWNIVHWARRAASSFSGMTPAASLFDPAWYLGENPDVAATHKDPLKHYLRWGAREGRDPNPLFDSAWYLERNPDVAAAGLNPLIHYWDFGALEGRDPNPFFSTNWYLARNPDVAASKVNPLGHYLTHGEAEFREPHPLFHTAWYLAQNPEVAGVGLLEHYLKWGRFHGLSPHPLFDTGWYLKRYVDVAEAGAEPVRHYLKIGAAEGREPHPLFDSKWYLNQEPKLADTGQSPLLHYLRVGAKERRSPHPMFDARWYAETYRDAAECHDLLTHYLTIGWRRGYKPNPYFDPQGYLEANPDIAEKGLEPLTHFVLHGREEGRKRSAGESSFNLYQADFEIPREPLAIPPPVTIDLKAIAFYLPQFHRISENDAWWGEGFTEWNNVRRGLPNFLGHYQPHVPTALGYYDLEKPETLEKQIELAKSCGLHGFCFYYYWFGGKVLLDLPLRRLVENGELDFPFCLCWANENWTRRWDGQDQDILISQRHSPEDDLAFIRQIEPILLAKNYLRVGGKPQLLVYRPSLLPDAAATVERWRSYFRERGHGELHLVMVRSFTEVRPESYGFDAVVQFPPHSQATLVTEQVKGKSPSFKGHIYDYSVLRRDFLQELREVPEDLTLYAGVMPSWDNTARRLESSSIWINSSPEAYYEWLSAAAELVRQRPDPNDRFLFINAWNEWAEGCHLEPDEKFGHAWLNATALALQPPSSTPAEENNPIYYPEPPIEEAIALAPLPASIKLAISVLFYHREDIIPSFLEVLLPQIKAALLEKDLAVELYLAFNYKPTAQLQEQIRDLLDELLPAGRHLVHLVENGFNVGFGAGHNAVFERAGSDLFLMLNSDVRIPEPNWLRELVHRFVASDAAIVGLTAAASRLREDGCGIPIAPGEQDFDFVDGSVLAIRSDLARRYGLFSDAFDYFYFEDADLCLRYRQLGLGLELLDLPYEHERSSSSRLLPQYALESVLNRNRARFFQRWEHYLQTREIPNRLAVRFLEIDRQLQCAALPAIFGLLSEHPTAILDLSGVHEQLSPLFRHSRIRLIPSWQTLSDDDYLRYYEIGEASSREEASMVTIAARLGCKPDLEGTRDHLRSLLPAEVRPSQNGRAALLFVPRKEPLFEGRQPEPETFASFLDLLSDDGWQVDLITDLGRFEVEGYPAFAEQEVTYAGASTGLEILKLIVASDLVVSCDNWISELGQLLDKKTFVWLGATSSSHALWNLEKAGFFSDRALPCLGCYHRFGHNKRNTCLRGDIACMREELAEELGLSLRRFLDGAPMTAAELGRDRHLADAGAAIPSSALRLADYWPPSRAASVLVLIPLNPKLDPAVGERARQLAEQAVRGMHGCRIVLDEDGSSPPRGVPHPNRQKAMAAIRQAMVERHLKDERWVFWIDADIVRYSQHLVDELINRAEGGIAAPIVLMEGNVTEPLSNRFGFGPGRFYDVAGFVENGRWARFTPPFFDQPGPVYQLDSVGSCYLVNADLYRHGARHEADFASRKFVERNDAWPDNSIARNQAEAANSFSEHYSVCEFTRRAGLPVRAFADLIAYHEKPPVL